MGSSSLKFPMLRFYSREISSMLRSGMTYDAVVRTLREKFGVSVSVRWFKSFVARSGGINAFLIENIGLSVPVTDGIGALVAKVVPVVPTPARAVTPANAVTPVSFESADRLEICEKVANRDRISAEIIAYKDREQDERIAETRRRHAERIAAQEARNAARSGPAK